MLGVRVVCQVMPRMQRASRQLADWMIETRCIQWRKNLPKRTLSTTSVMGDEEKPGNLPKPDSGVKDPKSDAAGQPTGPSGDPHRDADRDPYKDADRREMMERRMRSSDPYYREPHHRTQPQNEISPQGEFLPGHLLVSKALRAKKRNIHKIYMSEAKQWIDWKRRTLLNILLAAEERNIPVQYVTYQELDKMGKFHAGILADVSKLELQEYKFGEAGKSSSGDGPELWLVVSSIQSTLVLGRIIRSSYCLGTKTIITSNSPNTITWHVSHNGAGTPEVADVYKTDNLREFLQEAKERGKHIIGHSEGKSVTLKDAEGADMTLEATPLSEVTLAKDSILFFDMNYMKHEMLGLCDEVVTMPRSQGDDTDVLAPPDALNISQYHLLSSALKGH